MPSTRALTHPIMVPLFFSLGRWGVVRWGPPKARMVRHRALADAHVRELKHRVEAEQQNPTYHLQCETTTKKEKMLVKRELGPKVQLR